MNNLADRLLKKKLDTENKIKQQRDEKERNELVGCTFHPNIQNNSALSVHYYSNNIYNRGASAAGY